MTNETLRRLPRFRRHRFGKPALALQARDQSIIRTVSSHRLITSEDLQLLVGGSNQGILRRLQKLYHHGFLDRPRCQRGSGNSRIVYALGQHGADFLARETGQRQVVDWAEKNRQVRMRYLEHALMISRFQAAVRHAADIDRGVVLERWYPDGFIREAVVIEHRDRRERIPVAPDGFFLLRLLSTGEVIHGYLEADRSTMTVSRFVNKLRGYWQFWRSGRQEEILGAKNCLVVTVTTSVERAMNLRGACRSIHEKGLRRFLFAAEREYLPAARRTIFDPIWHTPSDPNRHSLLE